MNQLSANQKVLGMHAAKSLIAALKSKTDSQLDFNECQSAVASYIGFAKEQPLEFMDGFVISLTDFITASFDGAVDVKSWNPAIRLMNVG
ncbi:hypothetical protein [Undibacterium crateris]|uniref:hypothetical protein n=1 Tax=Undibacterium crateris TaxID=2528175 RepID=UPI00138961ED|nr:hypothetical protein [Undibacterium crateris]NDI85073.1 hypothetical protein [Undibacterium crateris]